MEFITTEEADEQATIQSFYAMPKFFRQTFGWAFGLPVDEKKLSAKLRNMLENERKTSKRASPKEEEDL